jgi:hypothetical protein
MPGVACLPVPLGLPRMPTNVQWPPTGPAVRFAPPPQSGMPMCPPPLIPELQAAPSEAEALDAGGWLEGASHKGWGKTWWEGHGDMAVDTIACASFTDLELGTADCAMDVSRLDEVVWDVDTEAKFPLMSPAPGWGL